MLTGPTNKNHYFLHTSDFSNELSCFKWLSSLIDNTSRTLSASVFIPSLACWPIGSNRSGVGNSSWVTLFGDRSPSIFSGIGTELVGGFGITFILDSGESGEFSSGEPISTILSIDFIKGFDVLLLALLISSLVDGIGVVDGVILGSITRVCRPKVRCVGDTGACSTQFWSIKQCKWKISFKNLFLASKTEIEKWVSWKSIYLIWSDPSQVV